MSEIANRITEEAKKKLPWNWDIIGVREVPEGEDMAGYVIGASNHVFTQEFCFGTNPTQEQIKEGIDKLAFICAKINDSIGFRPDPKETCEICGAAYQTYPLWAAVEQYDDMRCEGHIVCQDCFNRLKEGWQPFRGRVIMLRIYEREKWNIKQTIIRLEEGMA